MVMFDHFWGEKVTFWTVSKLFYSNLGSVRVLFLDLNGPFVAVFSAQMANKCAK